MTWTNRQLVEQLADIVRSAANHQIFEKGALAFSMRQIVRGNLALRFKTVGGKCSLPKNFVMPLSLALADRQDASLGIGDALTGADDAVASFHAQSRPGFPSSKDVLDALSS